MLEVLNLSPLLGPKCCNSFAVSRLVTQIRLNSCLDLNGVTRKKETMGMGMVEGKNVQLRLPSPNFQCFQYVTQLKVTQRNRMNAQASIRASDGATSRRGPAPARLFFVLLDLFGSIHFPPLRFVCFFCSIVGASMGN